MLTELQIETIIAETCGTYRTGDSYTFEDVWNCIEKALAAHSAGAQEPVAYTSADRLKRITERNRHVDTMWPASMRDEGDIPLYAHPQPMPQTDAARDMKRWREKIIQAMRAPSRGDFTIAINAIVREMTAAIERLDRAKGE